MLMLEEDFEAKFVVEGTVKFFAQKAKTIPAQSRDDLEYKEMI